MDSVTLSAEEVARLGRLARIELSEDEQRELAPQLTVILESVARVAELDTEGIPPTSHPEPLTNVFRDDEVRPSLSVEQALDMAPVAESERFRVPRILGSA